MTTTLPASIPGLSLSRSCGCGGAGMTRQQEARQATEWHKQQEARGEDPWSCRLFDGEDNGPPERRCWLQPGHQCECMTEAETRALVAQPVEEFMAHNDAGRHVYALTLDGKTHLVSTDERAAEELRAGGIQIARTDDEQAMEPLLVAMHPQARGMMELGLARSFERLGRAAALLMSLPDVSEPVSRFAPDKLWISPDIMKYLAPPDSIGDYHPPDPNAGKQAPPLRREWWAEQWKGNGTPGLGCQRRDKAKNKAQKQARKGNRSKK